MVFSLANVRPGVTGGGSLAPILETEPARPEAELNGAYAKSKAAAERLVLAASSHALRVVVLRPGGVYGMADSVGTVVGAKPLDVSRAWQGSEAATGWVDAVRLLTGKECLLSSPSTTVACPEHVCCCAATAPAQGMTPQILAGQPWVGPGKVRVPFVWVEDAARAHVLAAEQLLWPQLGPDGSPAKRIHGRAYHITHDPVREPLLYHEFGGGVPTAIEDLAALGIADRSHPDVVKAEEQAGVHTTRNCAALRAARVSAYGCVANSSVPFPVVWFLARLNFWLGQRFGFVLVDARSTPENMIYASNHWPCDVRDARAVLGWEPTPFRVVAAALGEAGADADPKAAKRYKSLTVGGAEEKKTK